MQNYYIATIWIHNSIPLTTTCSSIKCKKCNKVATHFNHSSSPPPFFACFIFSVERKWWSRNWLISLGLIQTRLLYRDQCWMDILTTRKLGNIDFVLLTIEQSPFPNSLVVNKFMFLAEQNILKANGCTKFHMLGTC